jgi:hypothetical protein
MDALFRKKRGHAAREITKAARWHGINRSATMTLLSQ